MSDIADQKVIKCVIVGNSNVGKTTLMDRLVNDAVATCPHATIGVECRVVHLPGRKARVRFWDTAGMEQFDAITKIYYRGVDCAIVCYSEQDDSINDVAQWVERIRQEHDGVSRKARKRIEADCCEGRHYVVLDDGDDEDEHHIPILLVATKVDDPLMCSHHDQAVALVEELCLQGPVYTSAKTMSKQEMNSSSFLRQDDGHGPRGNQKAKVKHRHPHAAEHPVLPVDVRKNAKAFFSS